ncbi:hypothetical protein [Mesorhizobium sp. L-8-3]|uniref:hypothetical protein n=1 Tax=Mesorhizobium sp. L-8-3 TaxID=2744522 RepID=UPI001926971A|nr:hypothetical protein [Mesorhizobium sp. L-8-3]BCH20795.1 hypothetical protein MesoLjLb_05800 [Mesorhizobium sp. L-8-3]
MRDDWRFQQLPPPEGSEDRPDGFVAIAILAFVVVGFLIYFGPQLGAVETWFVDMYRTIESWVAPIREFVLG